MKNRVAIIEDRLNRAFAPSYLEVIDESEQHRGHAGSQGGAGHYCVKIQSVALEGLSRIEAHRRVYAALSDLIPHEIHALRIST